MLLVFTLSITPTIVFHNWLADHTDTVRKITNNQTGQIGKITFNCHCDNIVAESPFTENATASILPPLRSYNLFKAEKQVLFFYSPSPLHALRGPPVV
jgi:hypothetical protein